MTKGRDRNAECPCGSGRKAKRCAATPECAAYVAPKRRRTVDSKSARDARLVVAIASMIGGWR